MIDKIHVCKQSETIIERNLKHLTKKVKIRPF